MSTEYGPCEAWPVRWTCDVSCESPEITGTAVDMATEILWGLSGRQFGLCEVTLRPCRRDCVDDLYFSRELFLPSAGSAWPYPALIGGEWFNMACGSCGDNCSCSSISEVILPAPVRQIISVKVDGATLVTGSYRVDDGRKLVRLDGEWPLCNDLNKADTEDGTWSVTARYGREIPATGESAIGELACELMKAMRGEDCRMPKNVSQLARQGVTIKFPDVSELFVQGRTGLFLTDLFIATFNPARKTMRSKTYSVDGARARRTNTATGTS